MTHDEQIATLKLERDAQRDEAIRLRLQLEALEVRVAQLAEAGDDFFGLTAAEWKQLAEERASEGERGLLRRIDALDAQRVEWLRTLAAMLELDVRAYARPDLAFTEIRVALERRLRRLADKFAPRPPCACCICRGLEGAMLVPAEMIHGPANIVGERLQDFAREYDDAG